ncbi:MAG: dGTP triphosphohydrolase [Planctomycetota bacterium]|jgi:dGTPase
MAWLRREDLEDREARSLSPSASHSRELGSRRGPEKDDTLRTAFQRDRDRIIHCAAFRRLQHKTQVFAAYAGDHYRSRMIHSLELSQMARGVADCLSLNRDLAEAVALAHDLGHPPYGHSGEEVLDELMAGKGGFRHNAQGSRIVDLLEDRHASGLGLNLCLATRRSLLKGRVPEGFPLSSDLEPGRRLPIEAQVVDRCDKIAYLSHDLDDALRAQVLREEDVVELRLLQTARQRLGEAPSSKLISQITSLMIHDLVQATDRAWASQPQQEELSMHHSDQMRVAIDELLRFLRERFYKSEMVLSAMQKGRDRIRMAFAYLLQHPEQMPGAVRARIEAEGLERTVCDYVAGMTDRFLVKLTD